MDGLAEHALVEFASCFDVNDGKKLTAPECSSLSRSLGILISATDCPSIDDSLKPTEILNIFQVGTQRRKGRAFANPPKPEELKPLRDYERTSVMKKAKMNIKMELKGNSAGKYKSPTPHQAIPSPDYMCIERMCHVVSNNLCKKEFKPEVLGLVGHRLLQLRCRRTNLSSYGVNLIDSAMKGQVDSAV
jgi:hypothetical protein